MLLLIFYPEDLQGNSSVEGFVSLLPIWPQRGKEKFYRSPDFRDPKRLETGLQQQDHSPASPEIGVARAEDCECGSEARAELVFLAVFLFLQ